MIQECKDLLEEFLTTNDSNEALLCLQNLHAPSFHPHFVREVIYIGLQKGLEDYKRMATLLKSFYGAGVISQYSILRGFRLVHESRNDLKSEFPNINELFHQYTREASNINLLPSKEIVGAATEDDSAA